MKQPLSLEVLHAQALNLAGASACHVPSAKRVYIVGGKEVEVAGSHDDAHKKASHNASPYLSIQAFDLGTMEFSRVLINASGQYNLAFHATVVVKSDMLMIGGRLLKSHIEPQLSSSLIRIRDSDFGIGCKVLLENAELLARQGHCAHALSISPDSVLVFGGFSYADPALKNYSKVYRADVCIIEKASAYSEGSGKAIDTWTAAAIEVSGAPPKGRAYFSSSLLASDSGSDLLLVHGGKTIDADSANGTLLDDLWVLEITKTEAVWKAVWSPLSTGDGGSLIGALQCHKMFPLTSFSNGAAKLCVYGGLVETYISRDDFVELTVTRSDDGLFTCTACPKDKNNNLGEGASAFYNFGAAIAPIYDATGDQSPSCVFVFGGLRDSGLVNGKAPIGEQDSSDSATAAVPCLMVAVENSSDVVSLARKCFRDRRAEGDLAENSVSSQLQLYDRIRLADGSSYEGETIEELDGSKTLHGSGKLTNPDGSVLEGSFVSNFLEGEGRHVDAEKGLVYEGSFVSSVYCGKGRLARADGQLVYTGDFKDGFYHGYGVLNSLDEDGTTYEGCLEGGCRAGQGRVSFSTKPTVMNGNFARDVMIDGNGVDLAVENDNRSPTDRSKETRMCRGTYSGQLKHSRPHGKGAAVWEDGSRYEGGWINSRRGGLGIMTYSDGDVYEGKMRGDLRCGGGRWASASGRESYSGQWLDGDIDGFGVYNYADGSVYEGSFKKGMKNLSGKFRKSASSGSRRGSDELIAYEGSYYNDQRHGCGKGEYADGSTRSGMFEFDDFVAQ